MIYTDTANDGCDWYAEGTNYTTCGNYDSEEFHAKDMCCACGGGSPNPIIWRTECKEQDFGAKDNGGDSCDWYMSNERMCGVYDDDDFDAKAMCCSCDGGKKIPIIATMNIAPPLPERWQS